MSYKCSVPIWAKHFQGPLSFAAKIKANVHELMKIKCLTIFGQNENNVSQAESLRQNTLFPGEEKTSLFNIQSLFLMLSEGWHNNRI